MFPVYLKVGSKLDLLCEQSNGFKVQWYKAEHSDVRNYKLIDSSSSTGIYTVAYINHTFNHKLTIENVVVSDTGSYKCAVQSGSDMPFAVNVYVLQGRKYQTLMCFYQMVSLKTDGDVN